MSSEYEVIPGWWAAPDDYDHGDWGVWRKVRDARGEHDHLIVGCIPEGMARHWANSDRLAVALRALALHPRAAVHYMPDEGCFGCTYCAATSAAPDDFPHADYCEIVAARDLLADLT